MFSETGSLHYKQLIKVNKYITFFPYKINTTKYYYALSLEDNFLLNQPEYLL